MASAVETSITTFRTTLEVLRERKLMDQFSDVVPFGDEVNAYVLYRRLPQRTERSLPWDPVEITPYDPSWENELREPGYKYWVEKKTTSGTGRAHAPSFCCFEKVADDPAHQKYLEEIWRYSYPEFFGEDPVHPRQVIIRAPTAFEAPMEGSKYKVWNHYLDTVYNPLLQTPPPPALKPGGVLISRVLTALFETDDMVAASLDPEHGEVLLIGKQRTSVLSMPLDPDYVTVALRAALSGELLAVSIDPGPDLESKNMLDVSYYGGAENTTVGQVMFEADRMLKVMAMRWDNEKNTPFKNLWLIPDLLAQEAPSDWTGTCEVNSRFWITPAEMSLSQSPDELSVRFKKASMRVNTELTSPKPDKIDEDTRACIDQKVARNHKFAQAVTENYDVLAQEWPLLEELRQMAKTVNLVGWLVSKTGIDEAAISRDPRKTFTPTTTPSREVFGEPVAHPPWVYTSSIRGGVELTNDATKKKNSYWADAFAQVAKESRPKTQWRAHTQVAILLFASLLMAGVTLGVVNKTKLHERKDKIGSVLIFLMALAPFYALGSTRIERFFPPQIDPIWSFTYEGENFLVFALPVSQDMVSASHSSMLHLPLIWQSKSADLDPDGHGVKVIIENTCDEPMGLWVDGRYVRQLPTGKPWMRPMSPGKYTLKIGEAQWEIRVKSRYSAQSFKRTCGGSGYVPSPITTQPIPSQYMQLPDLHRPDLHRPDLHRPDLHRPDLHRPDLHRPDLHRPDLH
ncbi:hypothetical protein HZA87_02485, partial [Candidatus Uhrbacteria bacterium]|nr:hypothetical protein [Candidatus Uhrbacteria bacterium]